MVAYMVIRGNTNRGGSRTGGMHEGSTGKESRGNASRGGGPSKGEDSTGRREGTGRTWGVWRKPAWQRQREVGLWTQPPDRGRLTEVLQSRRLLVVGGATGGGEWVGVQLDRGFRGKGKVRGYGGRGGEANETKSIYGL